MSRTPGDHYELLGVAQDATTDEIKKAYRALAKQYHPDVTGPDPDKLEHFKRVKAAYETLSDPSARSRYDRSRQPRAPQGYRRMPGGFYFWEEPPNQNEPEEPRGQSRKDRSNDIDLEDIFGDFGGFVDFGFGSGAKGAPPKPPRPQPSGAPQSSVPGTDISMRVDVPADVARSGGTVTVTYKRQRRTEDGRGLFEYDELYDLKVPPGTTHGDTLRNEGWGNAGSGGGPYGDLVCDVRVVGASAPKPGPRPAASEAPSSSAEPAMRVVPISIQESLLGGRVELQTPQGQVVLNLPPCTSGGAKFRLRAKGEPGPDGRPTDLMIQLRVVTPPLLDDESVRLIQRFAELNQYNPRD